MQAGLVAPLTAQVTAQVQLLAKTLTDVNAIIIKNIMFFMISPLTYYYL